MLMKQSVNNDVTKDSPIGSTSELNVELNKASGSVTMYLMLNIQLEQVSNILGACL